MVSLLVWVLVGMVTGLLANMAARSFGLVEDIIVGVTGSVSAGWLFVILTGAPVTGVSLTGVAFALAGAMVFVVLSRGLTRGRSVI